MQLLVLGLSHKTAPLQLRERFAIPDDDLALAAEKAKQAGFSESFVVSTCNRVEFYVADEHIAEKQESLTEVMAHVGNAGISQLRPHVYRHEGMDAIIHLFRVAASLDSMVVGEPQILGQLKSSFERCRLAGVTGPALNRAAERAFATAKRVRTETGIGRHVVSISSVAVQLAHQIFGQLDQKTGALIGAGKMGELAARQLVAAGIDELYVANRSVGRAREVANSLGGHPRELSELPRLLSQADIVITSTGSRQHLIDLPMMKAAMKVRKYRPIFFIDIAVPRNVSPALNELDNVYVYDVDDLNGIAEENREARRGEADLAERMVIENARRFLDELAGQQATPTIIALRGKVDEIKRTELDKALRRLHVDDDDSRRALEQLADSLVAKLLHGAMSALKRGGAGGSVHETIEVVRKIYQLDDEELP
jgi:glutamyl-tRNA reductase